MKYLSEEINFLGLTEKHSNFSDSEIVIVSAPLEKTVSYGEGTSRAPEEILSASHYVEFYDEELKREICYEKGICTLKPLELTKLPHDTALGLIESTVSELINLNKFVVTLGGEHSLSAASFTPHNNKYSNLSVLQIDAHSDLRDEYEGSKLSHASVMSRIFELNKNLLQVGIRAQCIEESQFIENNNISTYYMRDIRSGKHGSKWQGKVVGNLQDNVYITFDVDGLDPSVISETGTPEPGGLFWDETMDLLKLVGESKNIVGFDVVELSPDVGSNASSFTTAKLIYKMIGYSFHKK
jgi:agmatinase